MHDEGTRKSALAFLIDAARITEGDLGVVLGVADATAHALLSGGGDPIDNSTRQTIDRIIATQSLLLSGYSPDRAAQWYAAPDAALDGRAPRDVVMKGPDGVRRVLLAAYDRIAS